MISSAIKNNMNKKILKRVEELFMQKLQTKTNWGRNKVIKAYREATNEALMELLNDDL